MSVMVSPAVSHPLDPVSLLLGGVQGAKYLPADMATLWQDRARTTPCTAVGQLVGAIDDPSPNMQHLIADTDGSRGTLAEVDGRRCVRLASGNRYAAAAMRSVVLPCYLLAAFSRPSGGSLTQIFGISGDNNNRFQIVNHSAAENRVDSILRNVAHGQVVIESEFEEGPYNAPIVVDVLAVAGAHDVAVNGATPNPVANSWTGGSSTAGSERHRLAPVANIALDFYGGFILQADPGVNRAAIVDYFRRRVERPARATDINLLVLGDSTGDAQGECFYRLLAEKIAADDPTAFVGYRLFSNYSEPKKAYWAEIVVQEGTGGPAYRMFNGSIAGSKCSDFIGGNFGPTIGNIPEPAVIFWNFGHNMTATPVTTAYTVLMDPVRTRWPNAKHIAIRQNPWRDTNSMAGIIAAFDQVVLAYGDIAVADVYQRYIDLLKDPSLYADAVHPSIPVGVDEWMPLLIAAWELTYP